MNSGIRTDIKKLLKRFSFQGICDTAILQFPEINLQQIRRKYNTLTKANVMKEILLIVNTLTEMKLKLRFSKLRLLLVHDLPNKTWYAWRLKSLTPFTETREFMYNLRECLQQQWIFADVDMIRLPGKYLIRIKKLRNRFGVLKNQSPVTFQYYFNEPYLFCGRKAVQDGIMCGVVGSLGYDLYKMSPLHGPNVHYLLSTLKSRDAGTRNGEMLASVPAESREITKTNGREDNVQEIIGVNQPQLENVTSIVPLLIQKFENKSHPHRVLVEHIPALEDNMMFMFQDNYQF